MTDGQDHCYKVYDIGAKAEMTWEEIALWKVP